MQTHIVVGARVYSKSCINYGLIGSCGGPGCCCVFLWLYSLPLCVCTAEEVRPGICRCIVGGVNCWLCGTVVQASDRRQGLIQTHKQLWVPCLSVYFSGAVLSPLGVHISVDTGDRCQARACKWILEGLFQVHIRKQMSTIGV